MGACRSRAAAAPAPVRAAPTSVALVIELPSKKRRDLSVKSDWPLSRVARELECLGMRVGRLMFAGEPVDPEASVGSQGMCDGAVLVAETARPVAPRPRECPYCRSRSCYDIRTRP